MTDQKTPHASSASLLSVKLGVNEYRKACIEYERMTAPWIRARGEVVSAIRRTYLLKHVGETEIIEQPTPEQTELLVQIDEMLRYIQGKCFTPNVKVRG